MSLVKPIQPCSRECPRRSVTCRRSCREWIEYEERWMAYNEERKKEIVDRIIAEDYEAKRKRRLRIWRKDR